MNGKFFYIHLAQSNIKRNQRNFIPFWLSCAVVAAFFFNLANLQKMIEDAENVYGNTTVAGLLSFGTVIVAVLAGIFVFYANSFLMKNRKKEIGLYGILGLEKRHVARMLFYESIAIAGSSIATGIFLGMVFGKLVFWLLTKLIRYEVGMRYTIYVEALLYTLIFFGLLFLGVLIYNLISMHLTEPIELLKSKNQGEKRLRFIKLTALAGVLCLAGGYYIAITVVEPLRAMFLFFVAVLLVIAATHYLFQAGSVLLLGALKKNKYFYYRPTNFISTSSLIYRMKKNAAGLANICILSCMVMVTVAGTATVYSSMERITQEEYPTAYKKGWTLRESEDKLSQYKALLKEYAEQTNVAVEGLYDIKRLQLMAEKQENRLTKVEEWDSSRAQNYVFISAFLQEDYEEIVGKALPMTLESGEILVSTAEGEGVPGELELQGIKFKVKSSIEANGLINRRIAVVKQMAVIVADDKALRAIEKADKQSHITIDQEIYFNLQGEQADIDAFEQRVKESENLPEKERQLRILSREGYQVEMYAVNGGLYFIGIFLGSLFLLLTVLIIYFKQISEGEEDRERFVVLKKVGLSQKEAKGVIHKQLVMIFFLPLATAILHVSVAIPIIARVMMMAFGILLSELIPYVLITMGVFASFYFAVYFWTSQAYYRVVEGKRQ